VTTLQKNNCNAIGLTGADGNVIKAVKRPVGDVDFGFVGDVEAKDVNTSFLYFLLKQNVIPVFAPLTYGNGTILNTNADTIASVLAVALSKHFQIRLIYCFEKKGVLKSMDDENSVINLIDTNSFKKLKDQKILFDGILPKLENAFDAINNGVNEVLIGSSSSLLKNMGDDTEGTLIKM
jgi:acetylglutamate kinase